MEIQPGLDPNPPIAPSARIRRREACYNIGTIVLIIAGIYWSLRLFAMASFPPEVTDPARYKEVLDDWTDTGLVAHFPSAISANAKNVHFSALPKILQGMGHIQLRMQLPAAVVQQIETQFQQSAAQSGPGGGGFNFPLYFWATDNPNAGTDFPDDYTQYLIFATDFGIWDHGEARGVAVSTRSNEVVYWAQGW